MKKLPKSHVTAISNFCDVMADMARQGEKEVFTKEEVIHIFEEAKRCVRNG